MFCGECTFLLSVWQGRPILNQVAAVKLKIRNHNFLSSILMKNIFLLLFGKIYKSQTEYEEKWSGFSVLEQEEQEKQEEEEQEED